jgi:hypothetical protein
VSEGAQQLQSLIAQMAAVAGDQDEPHETSARESERLPCRDPGA